MVEFLLPLYEQAKFDEQKDTPIILSIDKAVPSDKKVYPPRLIYTIIISFFSVGLVSLILVMAEVSKKTEDPKVRFLLRNIFSLRRKED
jgi:hypothetical protein